MCSVDAARDRMEAALTGDLARTSPGEADDLLASLLDQVCDGATADEYVAHCVRSLPHSGEARALAVLSSWWAKGDYASAQRAFEEAMQAIELKVGGNSIKVDQTGITIKGMMPAMSPAALTNMGWLPTRCWMTAQPGRWHLSSMLAVSTS